MHPITFLNNQHKEEKIVCLSLGENKSEHVKNWKMISSNMMGLIQLHIYVPDDYAITTGDRLVISY